MKKMSVLGVALAMASSAYAAPNVTNATQKGSLLIWPDIRVDANGVEGQWNTLVRLQNDGTSDVDVKCYWMDGNKNRVDFIIPVTRNQAVWFDAASGDGTFTVNRFPTGPANGIDNPFLLGPFPAAAVPPLAENAATGVTGDSSGPYGRGLLACWAVDNGAQNQVKWNHLSGTATVYNVGQGIGAYEYNAYAFFVPTGIDLEPVGVAGTLNLNGVEYDSCPLYQIGQFTPVNVALPGPGQVPQPIDGLRVFGNRLSIAGCSLNLNQDWTPVWTKLQFDIWNEDEVKFTGAYECSDSWHETAFADPSLFTPATTAAQIASLAGGPVDSAAQNFQFSTLGTASARYRVQGVKSTQCERPASTGVFAITTQAVGVIAVQASAVGNGPLPDMVGTTLAAAGKFTGKIVWDPEGAVPEGGIK